MNDKRHYARAQFVERAHLHCNGGNFDCYIADISLKGALLHFSQTDVPQLKAAQECIISMVLEGSAITLEFHAHATHFNGNTIGFNFSSMDSDSMTHLRRLLELNTGDPAEIERELSYMIKNNVHSA